MVGKIHSGSGAHGCATYCLDHDEAEILCWEGLDIRLGDAARLSGTVGAEREALAREMATHIDTSFTIQSSLNPAVEKSVGHVALSFMKEDAPLLDNEAMTEIAVEYLQMMGWHNTQFMVVRHHKEGGNPHLHIFFNRVDNKGAKLNSWQDFRRNGLVCKELTTKFSLHFSTGRSNTNVNRLHASERVRYQISNAIDRKLPYCRSWQELGDKLSRAGVRMDIVYRGDDTPQGVKFSKRSDEDGRVYEFTGSKVGRNYTFGHIDSALQENSSSPTFCRLAYDPDDREEEKPQAAESSQESIFSATADVLLSAIGSGPTPAEPRKRRDDERKKKGLHR